MLVFQTGPGLQQFKAMQPADALEGIQVSVKVFLVSLGERCMMPWPQGMVP